MHDATGKCEWVIWKPNLNEGCDNIPDTVRIVTTLSLPLFPGWLLINLPMGQASGRDWVRQDLLFLNIQRALSTLSVVVMCASILLNANVSKVVGRMIEYLANILADFEEH